MGVHVHQHQLKIAAGDVAATASPAETVQAKSAPQAWSQEDTQGKHYFLHSPLRAPVCCASRAAIESTVCF